MHGGSYTEERRWADKFVPRQRRQLAKLFRVSMDDVRVMDDTADREGVDVMVGRLRIGLRVRRAYALAYGVQLTVRTSTGKDGRSEMDKIKNGDLDLVLLNYATPNASQDDNDDDDTTQVSLLLDLAPVRAAANNNNNFDGVRTQDREGNRCHFTAIDLGSLVAMHGPVLVATSITTTTTITTTRPDPITGVSSPAKIVQSETVENSNPELLDKARQDAKAVPMNRLKVGEIL